MKNALTNRIILMVATALATSAGTFLATAWPVVHTAFCGGG